MTETKTFLEDKFYQKPFCSKSELAERWNVSSTTIARYENSGLIKRSEAFDIKRGSVMYPVKQIMELEGLNENLDELDYRSLKKENKKLKEKLSTYEDIIAATKKHIKYDLENRREAMQRQSYKQRKKQENKKDAIGLMTIVALGIAIPLLILFCIGNYGV